MARPNQDAIDTFVSITGASDAIASRKLEEHGGDLNAAVNAYFGEGDTMNTHSTSVSVPQDDFMNIDDPTQVEPQGPLSLLPAVRSLNPFSLLVSSLARSFFEGRGTADFTNRSPWVSQPREVREIPIEVKDDTSRSGQSGTRPRIEEVTGSTVGDDQEVRRTVIINDEDDGDVPTSDVHTTPTAPESSHYSDYGDDIEEEMLKAAIEASKQEEAERLLAEKQASLPQEPALNDESAVTLLVRMPDGSRRGRRFLKSDRLQSLFDFIDIGRGVKPGSYRLVRPYPRRAFDDSESGLSFSELGLSSKQEALFLEQI